MATSKKVTREEWEKYGVQLTIIYLASGGLLTIVGNPRTKKLTCYQLDYSISTFGRIITDTVTYYPSNFKNAVNIVLKLLKERRLL